MRNYGKKLIRLFITLQDIGFYRLSLRLRYELRNRLSRHLPIWLSFYLVGIDKRTPKWLEVLDDLNVVNPPLSRENSVSSESIIFDFLNCPKKLNIPFEWNNIEWERLWQFNLHYFNWARLWLDLRIVNGTWCLDAANLEFLLDHWIKFNLPGKGDGWHSYTLSLRSRNWIWLFRTCPYLATPSRLKSLWRQLCWLQAHPERCHGGNHWIENLTALAIGGLQFEGSRALEMHKIAMQELKNELETQVLGDGGHEERSAAYHLLILSRLVELGCVIQSITCQRPTWLLNKIYQMVRWAEIVRLSDGSFVRFNDSPSDICPSIDQVIDFAWAYLKKADLTTNGLSALFYRASIGLRSSSEVCFGKPRPLISQLPLSDLPNTGWVFLRPGLDWELVFKCGQSSPKHLPAHSHSDLLTFDIFYKGKPFLAEMGTSVYGNCLDRFLERSYSAHNIFQLGNISQKSDSDMVEWIEPTEVWGDFRAARKANICNRSYGKDLDGGLWVSASHDAYQRFGSSHKRFIKLKTDTENNLQFTLKDTLDCDKSMAWRQWWHIAPNVSDDVLYPIIDQLSQKHSLEIYWRNTWYSLGFGNRIPRRSLCLFGRVPKGTHCFSLELNNLCFFINSNHA